MFVRVVVITSLYLLLIFSTNLKMVYGQNIKKIEWGTSYGEALSKFNFNKIGTNLFYVQQVNGVDLYVTYYFDEKKLSKIILDLYKTIGTNKFEQFETSISNLLSNKYGKPKELKRFGESSVYMYKSDDSLIKYHKGKEGWSRVHYIEYIPDDSILKKSRKLFYDLL